MVSRCCVALGAASAMLVLAGNLWLADRARVERARQAAEQDCEVVIAPSLADEARMHRVALKHETVVDLLDGRLTFDEALGRFWDVNTRSPESMANLREVGGSTDEERLVHQLLAFAHVEVNRHPARYGAAWVRLQAEASSRASHGPAHHSS